MGTKKTFLQVIIKKYRIFLFLCLFIPLFPLNIVVGLEVTALDFAAGQSSEFASLPARFPVNQGQISWESQPSLGSAVLPDLISAPMEQRLLFHRSVAGLFADKSWIALVREKFGVNIAGMFDGPGLWKGNISPGSQIIFELPEGGLTPDFEQRLNALSSVMRRSLRQDGVAWHVPDFSALQAEADGVDISISRAFSYEEMKMFSKTLNAKYEVKGWNNPPAVIASEGGVRTLNLAPDIVSNLKYQQVVAEAAQESLKKPGLVINFFKSHGNLIDQDWELAHYRKITAGEAQKSGLENAIDEVNRFLEPRLKVIREEFAQNNAFKNPNGVEIAYSARVPADSASYKMLKTGPWKVAGEGLTAADAVGSQYDGYGINNVSGKPLTLPKSLNSGVGSKVPPLRAVFSESFQQAGGVAYPVNSAKIGSGAAGINSGLVLDYAVQVAGLAALGLGAWSVSREMSAYYVKGDYNGMLGKGAGFITMVTTAPGASASCATTLAYGGPNVVIGSAAYLACTAGYTSFVGLGTDLLFNKMPGIINSLQHSVEKIPPLARNLSDIALYKLAESK